MERHTKHQLADISICLCQSIFQAVLTCLEDLSANGTHPVNQGRIQLGVGGEGGRFLEVVVVDVVERQYLLVKSFIQQQ